jgi:hypothetical protein
MTVHASKGLEFPIVFVVNLAKGASGFPKPVRVSGDQVSVGPFVSESDDEERFREREETKRLMYVAMTRARDRLYVGTVLKDGEFAIGRGSLGDVLPKSFRELFCRAAQESGDSIEWTAESGRAYRFRLCRQSSPSVPAKERDPVVSAFRRNETPSDLFDPLTDGEAIPRVSMAESAADWAVRAAHPEVAVLLQSGECLRQLAFSCLIDDPVRVIRGAIDVVRQPDGSIVVLAFSAGPPSAEESARLDFHVNVAREMFPGAQVSGRLVCAH